MTREPWMREAISAGREFHAMRQKPAEHNRLNLLWTTCVLMGIVGIIVAGAYLPTAAYLLLTPWLLGSLFFSLFILVIHECSHNMFVLSSDREQQKRWNRRIGMAFCAPFFTDYLKHWEEGHTIHHLRPCEPDDPQDREPITGSRLYQRIALILLVPGAVMAFNPSNQYGFSAKRFGLGVLTFVLPMVLIGMYWSAYSSLAILFGLQVLGVFNLLKKAQEHGGGLQHVADPLLRSRTYFYPFQRLSSPFNINYHFEHHANFSVPWYLLPAYHAKLRNIMPADLQPYFFHHRYIDQASGQFAPVADGMVYATPPAK